MRRWEETDEGLYEKCSEQVLASVERCVSRVLCSDNTVLLSQSCYDLCCVCYPSNYFVSTPGKQ